MTVGYALLVGVDSAGNLNTWGHLREMGQALNERGLEVATLHQAEATKQEIFRHINAAAGALEAGDLFVFYIFAHGGQMSTDVEPHDEPDGKDEIVVVWKDAAVPPEDYGNPSSVHFQEDFIRDDEFSAAWTRFRAGVSIVMIAHSCHSGSLYRRRNRIRYDSKWLRQLQQREMKAGLIYFGASSDDTVTKEYGLTFSLTQALREGYGDKGGYPELYSRIRDRFMANQTAKGGGLPTPEYHEYGAVMDAFRMKRCFSFDLPKASNTIVTVTAERPWQSIGVDVYPFTDTEIRSWFCVWTVNPGVIPMHGAVGYPTEAKEGYLLPGAPEGALVAKIGDSPAFLVGNGARVPGGQYGPLRLAANDDEHAQYGAGYADNYGACSMNVIVTPTTDTKLLANRNTREVHDLLAPCRYLYQIALDHRLLVREKPDGYSWCDYCVAPGDG